MTSPSGPGPVVVAQRLAGQRPLERLATVDGRPGGEDVQPGPRLVDAVDAVEAAIEADHIRRSADAGGDGDTDRDDHGDARVALPA